MILLGPVVHQRNNRPPFVKKSRSRWPSVMRRTRMTSLCATAISEHSMTAQRRLVWLSSRCKKVVYFLWKYKIFSKLITRSVDVLSAHLFIAASVNNVIEIRWILTLLSYRRVQIRFPISFAFSVSWTAPRVSQSNTNRRGLKWSVLRRGRWLVDRNIGSWRYPHQLRCTYWRQSRSTCTSTF